ncbi:condensin complex subunit 2/barren [Scheffersomyces coipomensis]|uniref:condensin complex subunit 2/barren n=1 Tax=Scheffersomyces coipomensis TaxID=1788519 RepID=UPI00315D0A13
MNSQVLPKKRGLGDSSSRIPSEYNGSPAVNTPNPSRIISNRIISNRTTPGNQNNRIISNHRVLSSSRHVSRSLNAADDSFNEESAIHFNENKHTILSNFEEWIKMSTDNKITSKNSWQFALIDYFHDMNVIKDGENINFQRASATLDGCVKIYSSRVESAATETGKLLSGLAKKKELEDIEENDEDEENEGNGDQNKNGENGEKGDDENEFDEYGRKKRKYNRIVETTLVDFETLRIKKLDQELAIDPLFKKALAEFDEGGAKSLLLNTLNIDASGRVVFDATSKSINDSEPVDEIDDDDDDEEDKDNVSSQVNKEKEIKLNTEDTDISSLKRFIFKGDEANFDDLTICPSLNEFHSAIEDMSKAKSILSDFNTKITAAVEEAVDEIDYGDNDGNYDDFGGYDDGDVENGGINDESGNNITDDPLNNINHSIMQRLFNESEVQLQPAITAAASTDLLDKDLMAYFDERMKSNWRGPEHWKVAALKNSSKVVSDENGGENKAEQAITGGQRKKPTQVVVDFFGEDEDEDALFAAPKFLLTILKKKETVISETILPDDIKYNSARLTNLFTKPQISIVYFPKKSSNSERPEFTDENYFANQYDKKEEEEQEQERLAQSFHQAEYDDFNNDFDNGDDYGAIDFNDALEGDHIDNNESDDKDNVATEQIMGRRRPEYVNFSRVAKRVDVKALKDNIWKSIKKEETTPVIKDDQEEEEEKEKEPPSKNFGELVNSVATMYGTEQRKDLSTSFYFICLLHLANEHGLTIKSNETYDDLKVVGF